MNLKQLGYFIAVAEELHFGRAAERLGMAQPPLSRQIKQIEEDLGAILFNRGRRTVSLTQAGERLLERGRGLIADVDDLKLEIRRLGQGAEGRLRIGFVGSSTYGILPNIIKSYRAHHPEVSLTLAPMNNAQLHRSLVQREIDVAFARPELGDAEFVTRHLQTEPMIAAVPDTLATGSSQTITLDEIATQAMILYPEYPRPSYADLVLKGCAAQALEVTNRIFTMDLQTALSLVAIGEGICVVPASVGSAARNGIRYCAIEPDIGETALSLNHRVDEQGQHVSTFVKIAQSVSRKTF